MKLKTILLEISIDDALKVLNIDKKDLQDAGKIQSAHSYIGTCKKISKINDTE